MGGGGGGYNRDFTVTKSLEIGFLSNINHAVKPGHPPAIKKILNPICSL